MPVPILTTARLTLRAPLPADAPRVRELAGDRAIADTTATIPHPYPEGAAERWIEGLAVKWGEGREAGWAICTAADGLVGNIGLRIAEADGRAELGYWIGVPYWGHGYATEACRAVVGFAFTTLGLRRVHACHYARNPASGRILEKIGMRQEGVLRRHTIKWDVAEDLVLWGMLRSEWGG